MRAAGNGGDRKATAAARVTSTFAPHLACCRSKRSLQLHTANHTTYLPYSGHQRCLQRLTAVSH
jgi:hypothetical protein